MRSTPAIEELKRNVDCSAFGKPGRARIGGVLRDHKGVVLCLFSAFVGIKESNETELLAVLKALELAVANCQHLQLSTFFSTTLNHPLHHQPPYPLQPLYLCFPFSCKHVKKTEE
jgi:hypothetical protein